jgi:hypothetical protein
MLGLDDRSGRSSKSTMRKTPFRLANLRCICGLGRTVYASHRLPNKAKSASREWFAARQFDNSILRPEFSPQSVPSVPKRMWGTRGDFRRRNDPRSRIAITTVSAVRQPMADADIRHVFQTGCLDNTEYPVLHPAVARLNPSRDRYSWIAQGSWRYSAGTCSSNGALQPQI